ncbi:hypothetical protein EVAR_78316_1 [Eumeta japonica]|uniref:Uncharacterized protein n=1 Tax=Eumeta variegata TaxID=151549 RepID=A0A4C1T439_EUMVA|nr:hypothetical protein EVAR_78316_1 [Eumeta japonica]
MPVIRYVTRRARGSPPPPPARAARRTHRPKPPCAGTRQHGPNLLLRAAARLPAARRSARTRADVAVDFIGAVHGASGSVELLSLAITCYQCNSHNDSRCLMDNLPESLKQPCGSRYTMCRKISQVVEFEMNGMPPDSRVIRGCGWDDRQYKVRERDWTLEGLCYQRSGFGGRQEVCSCLEDGCNSATSSVAGHTLVFGTMVLLRFW